MPDDEFSSPAAGEPPRQTHWMVASRVLGANDGIISIASLIVGVAAAATTHNAVLIAGVAGLVAGAMSMATGEYVSVSSQSDTERADLALEREELSNNPAYELNELAEIYVKRGVDQVLARQVAQQLMAKDALGAHARDELGISEITTARPFTSRMLISAASFSVGAVNALAYGCCIAQGHPCSDCVRCVFGFSCAFRCDRGKSRRRNHLARYRSSDILGCVSDGPHRKYRQIVWHGYLKIWVASALGLIFCSSAMVRRRINAVAEFPVRRRYPKRQGTST